MNKYTHINWYFPWQAWQNPHVEHEKCHRRVEVPVLIGLQNWHAEHPSHVTHETLGWGIPELGGWRNGEVSEEDHAS